MMKFKQSRDEYLARLFHKGYVNIGAGLYSEVVAKPKSNKVIKVGSYNDGWPDYIEWATIKGYSGSFAPKVYSLKYYETFYVATMERLVDTILGVEYEGGSNSALELYNRIRYPHKYPNEKTELLNFSHDLDNSHLKTDMHTGNVMLRHDGQIVVTDPHSNSSKSAGLMRIKRGIVVKSNSTIVVDFG